MSVDWQGIAHRVADGVGLRTGDRVSVFVTDVEAMDATSAFVDEVWKRGAIPQVLATDERFDASALRWASVDALAEPPALEIAAMEWSDVHVSFRAMVPPTTVADPDHVAALRRARGLVSSARWAQTRWALVRVPTAAWAAAFGVPAEALVSQWTASFDERWDEARSRMQQLCDALEGARYAVVSDQWGQLRMGLQGRVWVSFSGEANWPDGEIATAPVENDVDGTITFPGRFGFAGTVIEDLRLDIDAGQIVSHTASQGAALVGRLLDTDDGARRLGELGIGTNAALTTMTGDLLVDEKILGTMHVAPGRAYPQCGGTNSSALHWDIVKDLRARTDYLGGSLWVDDVPLIRDGVVQAPLHAAAVAAH